MVSTVMLCPSLRLSFLVAAATACLACGSGSSPGDGGVGPPGDGGDGGAARAGSVYELVTGPDGGLVPIAGAQVCVLDPRGLPCATTDRDGNYRLALPAAEDPAARYPVSFTAPGYLGRVKPAGDTWWPTGVGLRTRSNGEARLRYAGFAYPDGTAFVELRVLERDPQQDRHVGLAGATVTVSPPSGKIVYGDPGSLPTQSLTATSASGSVFLGNVAPGPVTITVNAPGKTCGTWDTSGTWRDSGPNTLPITVAADSVTDEVYLWCK